MGARFLCELPYERIRCSALLRTSDSAVGQNIIKSMDRHSGLHPSRSTVTSYVGR
jgi:hypothetical protein